MTCLMLASTCFKNGINTVRKVHESTILIFQNNQVYLTHILCLLPVEGLFQWTLNSCLVNYEFGHINDATFHIELLHQACSTLNLLQ